LVSLELVCTTLQRHNTENLKQIFPEKELRGLSPNFHIHVSVSDLYIPMVCLRVSFETSFDSKQPKREPNLVLALSETKHFFRLFRFYTKTESFDVSIE
jgi:hypothetical protein